MIPCENEVDLKSWYKAALKHESRWFPYSKRKDCDHFERINDTDFNTGFRRGVKAFGKRWNWNTRYGFPFSSYDNGYGIPQITNPHIPVQIKHITRWGSSIDFGWEILMDKYNKTIGLIPDHSSRPPMTNMSGRALENIPVEVFILESLKRYNGGWLFRYKNGKFVRKSSGYVEEVIDDYMRMNGAGDVPATTITKGQKEWE